jgi:tellurite resistance protein TerC
MEILLGGLAVSFLGKAAWMWLVFLGLVVVLLVLDLGVLHRKEREIGVGESLALSLGYIMVGLGFGAWVWSSMGAESGLNYLTGFAVEKSLALDNIFVISMIFSYFAVPRRHQHRVLFWGVLGVIVLRGIMIGLGAALVERFDWIMWLFGIFLAVTGIKMLVMADKPATDLSDNPMLKFLRRRMRVTPELHGHHFFVREAGPDGRMVWWATPLFLCLILVELADIVFAVDSVPAIFAITTDPYIVYTSNIFAILGLRALYFALAAMMHRFIYLKYALALVLVFIGSKIFWAQFYGKPDPAIALAVTIGLIGGGVVVSLWKSRHEAPPVSQDGRVG